MWLLLGFIAFAMIFGIFYMFYTTRNRERIALIEKGADASLFKTGSKPASTFGKLFSVLKVGLFLIGLGLGVAMGYFAGILGMHEGASYPSMILLFGGLGLVIYYLISKDRVE